MILNHFQAGQKFSKFFYTITKEVQEKDLGVPLLPVSAFWKVGALAVFSACPDMELLEYIFQLEIH